MPHQLQKKTVNFETTGDFELGMAGFKRKTDYHLYLPSQAPQGLVIFIPGFGQEAGDYREIFCQKIAQEFNFATLLVDYHCFFARPSIEQGLSFEKEDIAQIEKLFLVHQQPMQGKTPQEGLGFFNEYLKQKGMTVEVNATLKPLKNEYQNGGVMAALDILNAVDHVLCSNPEIPPDNVILVGASNGGYIANLASKFAPKTFRAVFDNSSWALPNFIYIVGREYGVPEFKEKLYSHVDVRYFTKTAWTLSPNLPNTFDGKRFHIRAFTDPQIEHWAKYNTQTFFYFVHAQEDLIAPTEPKIQMATTMLQQGMNVHMEVMSEGDVDGSYVKNLSHGMNLSMLTMFKKAYHQLGDHRPKQSNDFKENSVVSYPSDNCIYEFDFSTKPISARVYQE